MLRKCQKLPPGWNQCPRAPFTIPRDSEFLLNAAVLANRAADLEIGNQSLNNTYNPRSLYAMRILDQIDEIVTIDFDGRGEQRVFALLVAA